LQTLSLTMSIRCPAEALRVPMARLDTWNAAPPYSTSPALALEPGDLRILIVNEDMRSADSLKRTLRELGYRAMFTAYSARRGIEAAVEFSPALAILDLELPDMSGFQLANNLRAHTRPHVRKMKLLAIAERPLFANSELARAAGFIGCLTKPVPPMELNRLMRTLAD